MKKKMLLAMLGAISILLVACGSGGNKSESSQPQADDREIAEDGETGAFDVSTEVEKHYIVDDKELTEEEYQEYLKEKEQKKKEKQEKKKAKAEEEAKRKEEESKKTLGEVIDTDALYMTLDTMELSHGYEFSAQYDGYTSTLNFPADSGMVLLSLKGEMTSKYAKEMNPGFDMICKIYVNGNEYPANIKIFNLDEPKDCYTIVPQQTLVYYAYTNIPENLIDSIESCEVKLYFNKEISDNFININNNIDYEYTVSGMPVVVD